ncbi:MAG: HAMP domain-containing protein [Cohaesibacteraceae bacterium]|nr:HAMP domain-containing protein [Cohaesibacteraceae bacterium]
MADTSSHNSPNASHRSALSIGSKIYGLMTLCLSMLCLVAGISIWQMDLIGGEIESIAERDLPMTAAITKITTHQLEQAINFERAVRSGYEKLALNTGDNELLHSIKTFEKLSRLINVEIDQAQSLVVEVINTAATQSEQVEFRHIQKLLAKIHTAHTSYESHAFEIFHLLKTNNVKQVVPLLPSIELTEEKLDNQLVSLLHEIEKFTQTAAITAEAHEQFALKLIYTISISSLALGLVISIWLVRSTIIKPLQAVVEGIEALIKGDLDVDVKCYSNDEIGIVARACQTFKTNLIRTNDLEESLVTEQKKSEHERRENLLRMADRFDQNIGEIVKNVASSASTLQETAGSMTQIANTASERATTVADASEQASMNVNTVAAASEEMSASIQEINRQVAVATSASQQAVSDVTTTATQMQVLTETANKIGEVVNLISDIAEQTNLLALNATIESARAGDAGRGFAVVASEVKALASETAKATEGISKHVNDIQLATREAAVSIDQVGSVIQQVEESSTVIAAALQEQEATTREVARSVQQAASGTMKVSTNITDVQLASVEVGEASTKVMSAAKHLSGQAGLMRNQVDEFLGQLRQG